jgi:hypothetical protein
MARVKPAVAEFKGLRQELSLIFCRYTTFSKLRIRPYCFITKDKIKRINTFLNRNINL